MCDRIQNFATSLLLLSGGSLGGMQFRISAIFSPISANLQTEIGYFRYPQGSWINILSAFRRNDDWFPHFRTQNSPFLLSGKPQWPPISGSCSSYARPHTNNSGAFEVSIVTTTRNFRFPRKISRQSTFPDKARCFVLQMDKELQERK